MKRSLRTWVFLLALAAGSGAAAAPPATLAYQGRLASAGGTPVTATLGITFRLYDVPSGGAALWSETQPGVEVDGGNLAVELGALTALPASIFGRQLYLGIQVSGDSEMLPRPALTAAPFALRAAGTMQRTRVVSAEGTPAQNGAALLAAVAAIGDATALSPVVVELDAGTYDLGTATVTMPAHTVLAGRSAQATLITSAALASGSDPGLTVHLLSDSGARDLTARNTGIPPVETQNAYGLGAHDPSAFQVPAQRVRVERVVGESLAAAGTTGGRAGIRLCTSNSRFVDLQARAEGGEFAMGIRADCPDSTGVVIEGARVEARGGSEGVRGIYLAGGGTWRDIQAVVEVAPSQITAYGIRVFGSNSGARATLADASITLTGSDLVTPTQSALVEGLKVEYAVDLKVERPRIVLQDVKGAFVSGVRALSDESGTVPLRMVDASVRVTALQDSSQQPGEVVGVRLQGATPELIRLHLDVRCLPGNDHGCGGITQSSGPGPEFGTPGTGLQPGALRLEQADVLVQHEGSLQGTAQTVALQAVGTTQLSHSLLRVLRSDGLGFHAVVQTVAPAAALRITGSSLIADVPGGPAAACAVLGQGSAQLLGNVVVGSVGCGSGLSLSCAGTTSAGAGFVAAGCP